ALADMQAKLDKQLSDVGTKVAQLNEAIQQANSANTEAKGIVAEFAQLANSYTATLAEYENRMTTELASVRSEMNSKVSKNALTFNVRDFGAKGDGTNDDTSAFKAAISAAGESGDVFIPQGKYVITQTLT
ncbi:glycosyl hydrolase family 28-related protein, partial [Clostridioides difficile]|uniref:glycosyl hydrolase family 28-related protein n=1 Tax=Clostridioides difficile TaxID=1496 RepID=UPI0031B5824D